MAVTDIRWSEINYGIKEVIKSYRLPLLVKVTQGHFSGPDEDSLGQGQIVRFAQWQKIKRVKARDVRGRIITMPLSFGVPFGVVPYNMDTIRGKLTKLRHLQLKDLVRRYQLPQRVKISSKHFSRRELIIPGVDLISDTFDLVELYEEIVLQGNAINFGVLDETVLNIPLRNSEMEVIVGLGLVNGSQTNWDKLHASLTEKFNRKVRLPKIVDGKGVLIVHQIPSHRPRQKLQFNSGSEPVSAVVPPFETASVPRKEFRYKKRSEISSTGSTLTNRYRTAEKKPRRLIKVEDDELSIDGSETSSGLASPDGPMSPVFPLETSSENNAFSLGSPKEYYGDNTNFDEEVSSMHRPLSSPKTTQNPLLMYEGHDENGNIDANNYPEEDYAGSPKTTENPLQTYDRRHFEEGSTDSGHATWLTSGGSVVGDLLGDIATHFEQSYENTETPNMIQEYLHSVEQDTIVRNKHKRKVAQHSDLYTRGRREGRSVGREKLKYRSRSVQEFNITETPIEEADKARSMCDLDDNSPISRSTSLSRPKELFGTVAKINRFRPSLWSAGWAPQPDNRYNGQSIEDFIQTS